MKTISRTLVVAIVVMATCTATVLATDEISRKENDMKCTACHDKAGSKLLTDQGIYYQSFGKLDGFEGIKGTFGRCTACHVRKPGSAKLTKQGKSMAELVDSMAELREWLDEQHPIPEPEDD